MNYDQALELAKRYHHGQVRKKSGFPYVTHPIAVAGQFEDENYKIVAVLHDTLEDTKLTSYDLIMGHGLNMNLVVAIQTLTHLKADSYLNYILKCKNNSIAKAVKIEDIRHNMSDLESGSLRDKYMMALYILEN